MCVREYNIRVAVVGTQTIPVEAGSFEEAKEKAIACASIMGVQEWAYVAEDESFELDPHDTLELASV